MARQSREEIAKKLDEFQQPLSSPQNYQYFLLELILDVLVDIRDKLDSGDD